MITFGYVRILVPIANFIPPGCGIGESESGWMIEASFYEYIPNIVNLWLVANGSKFPVVLFVDGHTSHLTIELSKFCVE